MIASTERPSSTAVTEQPPPRQATSSRRQRPTARRSRGTRSGGRPSRASAPDRIGRGLGMSRQRSKMMLGRATASRIARSAGVLCSGAMWPGPRSLPRPRRRSAPAPCTATLRGRRGGPHPALGSKPSTGREVSPSTTLSLKLSSPRCSAEDGAQRLSAARPSREPRARPCRAPVAVHTRQRNRSSTMSCRYCSRYSGTRSMTSITRWKRSRSLSMTMSNGVVVVPSSL